MLIKDKVVRARECAGFTQSELARRIGRDRSTVHGWESGRREPSVHDCEAMYRACDIEAWEFWRDDKKARCSKCGRRGD